ncbi:hypothetical protein NL676_022514 [Syzygium grande]|nr:hypothetical protein NL676_022514 [Syzygium grande]
MYVFWMQARHSWEIDGSDLYVKEAIAFGGFGTVFRGTYRGRDVAGATYDTSQVRFRGARMMNVCCIVSEYYPRGSLSDYLSRHRRLSEDVIRRLALDVARGLSYLHDKGIIHGDVKPSNFLVDSNGTLKVTDFGLSHRAAYYGSSEVGGTMRYMAPEVIKDGTSSLKADVYSFGITLWEICHNKMPFYNVKSDLIDQAIYHHVISCAR